MSDPIVECTFFIPERRDGNLSDELPHEPETWDWLDVQLFELFDGRTIAPGWYEGFYRDPDTQQRVADKSRKIIVAVVKSQLARLRALLGKACVQFQQKMIYLSVGGRVEFIQAESL